MPSIEQVYGGALTTLISSFVDSSSESSEGGVSSESVGSVVVLGGEDVSSLSEDSDGSGSGTVVED